MLSNCKGNVVNRMNLEQYKGVFIYAQQVDNKIDAIALELLGKANDLAADLGTDVTAVLIGSDVKGLVDELAEYGADKVIVVDDHELKEYRTDSIYTCTGICYQRIQTGHSSGWSNSNRS